MSKYKAVLFDFDGTVMDTNEIILESWAHAFKMGGRTDFSPALVVPTFGEVLPETMPKFFPDRDPLEMVECYKDYQRHLWNKPINMFPGIMELLCGLKDRGFKIGIVTSRSWASTTKEHYNFEAAEMFDAIVSAEDTKIHKPDPTPCNICLKKLGVSSSEALFVGDSKYDVMAGRNAGIDTVLVDWTICCPPEIRVGVCKPTFVIEKPGDLYALL